MINLLTVSRITGVPIRYVNRISHIPMVDLPVLVAPESRTAIKVFKLADSGRIFDNLIKNCGIGYTSYVDDSDDTVGHWVFDNQLGYTIVYTVVHEVGGERCDYITFIDRQEP